MPERKKIIGFGRNTVQDSELEAYNYIVMDSTDLSVEEGSEKNFQIEGGSSEGRDKDPDLYVLKCNRRIGDESEVEDVLGFKETVETVDCTPDNGGLGVRLIGPSRHVAVKMDTKDGLVAIYTYKSKGVTDESGKLLDLAFIRSNRSVTYTAVDSTATGYSEKNPKTEGWYIKNGNKYYRSFDVEPQEGLTYYVRTVTTSQS